MVKAKQNDSSESVDCIVRLTKKGYSITINPRMPTAYTAKQRKQLKAFEKKIMLGCTIEEPFKSNK